MSDPLPVESATEQPRSRTSVWNRNFAGLVITQFAGATNDNILKTVLLLQFARGQKWFDTLGEGGTGIISLMLTVPFVLLLGFAGQLADRLPKHRIITATRLAEVPIAGLAMYGFFVDSPWTVLVAYVLLASESAFFSPSKYGSIREIVGDARLNEANGIINMGTNIAILFGIGIGGPLLSWSEDAVGIVLVVFALVGLGSSLMIRGLVPQRADLKRRLNPFAPYVDAIRSMRPGLIWAASLAWAWFYAGAIGDRSDTGVHHTPRALLIRGQSSARQHRPGHRNRLSPRRASLGREDPRRIYRLGRGGIRCRLPSDGPDAVDRSQRLGLGRRLTGGGHGGGFLPNSTADHPADVLTLR